MIDEKKLIRGNNPKAVLNTDLDELSRYKERKKIFERKNLRIDSIEEKVDSLEKKLDVILELLTKGK